MTTILSVQITINETKVSPARVTEEMVKGFVFLREGYFGLSEPDLSLDISTISVTKPKRERLSRKAEKPDAPTVDWSSIRVGSAHAEGVHDGRALCAECGWVDELDLIKDRAAITQWHGDSFGLF